MLVLVLAPLRALDLRHAIKGVGLVDVDWHVLGLPALEHRCIRDPASPTSVTMFEGEISGADLAQLFALVGGEHSPVNHLALLDLGDLEHLFDRRAECSAVGGSPDSPLEGRHVFKSHVEGYTARCRP